MLEMVIIIVIKDTDLGVMNGSVAGLKCEP